MTKEEKQKQLEELIQKGEESATRAKVLFEELAIKTAKIKQDLKQFKEVLNEQLAVE